MFIKKRGEEEAMNKNKVKGISEIVAGAVLFITGVAICISGIKK